MRDSLYGHQQDLTDGDLAGYAAALGLYTAAFQDQMRRHTHADRVRQDFLGGVRSGVRGTPTFFISGELYEGSWEEASLQAALERADS